MEEKLKDNKLYQEMSDLTNKLKKKISSLATSLFNKGRITDAPKLDFKSIDSLATI